MQELIFGGPDEEAKGMALVAADNDEIRMVTASSADDFAPGFTNDALYGALRNAELTGELNELLLSVPQELRLCRDEGGPDRVGRYRCHRRHGFDHMDDRERSVQRHGKLLRPTPNPKRLGREIDSQQNTSVYGHECFLFPTRRRTNVAAARYDARAVPATGPARWWLG
jgi:hypothetical protein